MLVMNEIPKSVRRLFWDVDASALDAVADEKIIIERVLNTGTLADWRWLISRYGSKVRASLSRTSKLGRDNVRPQSRRLAELLLK